MQKKARYDSYFLMFIFILEEVKGACEANLNKNCLYLQTFFYCIATFRLYEGIIRQDQ